ncbi:MBOAT family O-acyltransferase [Pelolinea submarina]|uniref:D-alanyl-lipoteichoic acid acyltransferase DltB (MBOAT superfamily) n=1 Tax=Pelolinea submarina TaxID=913107 RepID=A0A347ZT59_9CHLR|nr:MBOAT family O-acyltransferase [Pelolinea submarina]REG10935.1 D-alanyl-lipoteichoic acid acyltransferase DltB (MBOAT superfamily) [Pelolinea submarina]BBB48490.1 alginate O-acetyltransferase complex protein AlgI [Pelolinea submarina]
MTLIHIAVFIGFAILIRLLRNQIASAWLMFLSSLIFIFWLQPVSSIRSLEFWLPSILITLTVLIWGITSAREVFTEKDNRLAGWLALAVILGLSGLRYLNLGFLVELVNPPVIWQVIILILIAGSLLWLVQRSSSENKTPASIAVIGLIVVFVILKYPPAALKASQILRIINGQSPKLANSTEIAWVGYSYFAFRLIHVLREWQQGRKFNANLRDFMVYVLFFPAFIAGPIDRLDHFQKQLEQRNAQPASEDFLEGGRRIAHGLFYKFILADSLALLALNPLSAQQVRSTGWMWVLVYTYAFRLYFDFSGYTDLAIGISRLMGIQLPENFKQPYLAENLTVFWNRWHITLTQWFRTYYFNPVTRYLRTRKQPISTVWMIFFTQVSTMVLIALWHGISLNFVLWGLWNGLGMFAHNRWTEWRKQYPAEPSKYVWVVRAQKYISIFMTFNFIALGWVWFALPDINSALLVFSKLTGGV